MTDQDSKPEANYAATAVVYEFMITGSPKSHNHQMANTPNHQIICVRVCTFIA